MRPSRAALGGLALLLAAALACAGTAPQEPPRPVDPALWRAEAPQRGVLLLLGSVHLGDAAMRDLGPAVEAAFRQAEEIVVEVDLAAERPERIQALTLEYGMLEPPERLSDRLSAETFALLAERLEERGLAVEGFETMKPWLVSLMLVQIDLEAAGYREALGVDRQLMGRAAGAKPVVALETAAGQLRMLDGLPDAVQDLMLKDALVRSADFHRDVSALFDAWSRGDAEALEALLFAPIAEYPELELFYERVFFERNAAMAERLVELCRDGRTRLVIVGAGHLVGERGVPGLLAARGFRVRRVHGAGGVAAPPGVP